MMSDPNDFDTRPAGLAMMASAGVGLFLMLPVLVDGRPMGFFYADREVANAPPPDASQSDAIRLLRNEIVLALRTEPAAR
jgi:hypothetical protein